MTVPGSNLLKIALSALGKQTISYRRYASRTANAAGKYVNVYADPVGMRVSLQPLSRDKISFYGLDDKRSYVTVFGSADFQTVKRGAGADEIDWRGRRYSAEDNVDWFGQDGWDAVIFVDIGATPDAG